MNDRTEENGKVITTMSLVEAFLDRNVVDQMTDSQKNDASKEIQDRFNQILRYECKPKFSYQPKTSENNATS